MRIERLRVGMTGSTLGVSSPTPRISWRFVTDCEAAPAGQSAYEIRVRRADGTTETTGRVESAEFTAEWPFRAMRSRERVDIDMRAWDDSHLATMWSPLCEIEASLFEEADWRAQKIGPPRELEQGRESAVFRLRRTFTATSVRRARLYVTAHGLVVPYVNGSRVADEVLAPGWTSYDHRLRFRVHDVTDALREGRNAIGFELAEGWYRGRFGFDHGARGIYGIRIGVFAQLEIERDDGSREVIATDDRWHCEVGPVTFTNLYDGEEADLSVGDPAWCDPETDDAAWPAAVSAEFDTAVLEAADSPPVRRTDMLAHVAEERIREGVTRYDFGQNLVGRIRLRATGPAGATVTIRHAEVLEGGELGVRPLRLARATDRLTLAGEAVEWEPEFTTHGFRYAEIAVSDPRVRVEAVSAVVVHSDMERTGWLKTSEPLLNRLFDNAVWGLRGNFVDLPTDCPQRDERLGWTGDIHVFAHTATLLYDVSGVLRSWLRDLSAEQLAHPEHIPPMFVPSIIREPHLAAVWGDATVGVPWALYERDGDVDTLRASYPSMRAWIELVEGRLGPTGVWDTDPQLGDWLDPTAPADTPHAGRTDANLVATAYFARSAMIASRVAELLGERQEAERFLRISRRVIDAFRREYMTPSGRLSSDSQAAYAIAICFDLYANEEQLARGGARLRDLVRASGYRVGTGFVGTSMILDALERTGSMEEIWGMLSQTAPPSFLYPVTMGATTAWERWDSMLPDGRINPGEMTSFNHYALGAVAGWLLRGIGGVTSVEPGGAAIRIEPHVGAGVTWATSTQILPRGAVNTSWRVSEGEFTLDAVIPPGVTATVILPDGTERSVGAGAHVWSCAMPPTERAPEGPRNSRMVIRTHYP